MRAHLLGPLVHWLCRLWLATLRVRVIGGPIAPSSVIGFWHGDQMPLLRARPRTELVAPISLSRDGDLQDVVMGGFGIKSVRGSSSRGGLSVLRQLMRRVRGGAICLLALDGPRGPRKRVKPGVTALIKHGQGELWLAAVAVSRGYRLVSAWDKFLLPAPWSKVVVEFYGPVHLDSGASRQSQLAAIEARMEEAFRSAKRHLEELGGG